jgi:hypothetical protein
MASIEAAELERWHYNHCGLVFNKDNLDLLVSVIIF